MKKQNKAIQSTVAGILALGATMVSTSASAVPDQPKFWEKCAGIVLFRESGLHNFGLKIAKQVRFNLCTRLFMIKKFFQDSPSLKKIKNQ